MKTLEDIGKHAKAFEAATQDQQKFQLSSSCVKEDMTLQTSQYKKIQPSTATRDHAQDADPMSMVKGHHPVISCHNFKIPNHFVRVPRQDERIKKDKVKYNLYHTTT